MSIKQDYNGKLAFSFSNFFMGKLLLFDLMFSFLISHGQEPRLVLPIGHTDGVTSIQFSPDGKRVVTGSRDGTAKYGTQKPVPYLQT